MYDRIVSSKSLNNYGLWIILGLIFGIQIVMVGPLSIRVSTTPFSIMFRALILLLSIFLCYRIIFFPRMAKLNNGMVWLLVFFFIYSIRVICDLYVLDIDISPSLGGASRISQMMFGSIVIPLVGCSIVRIKKPTLGKYIFYASLLQSSAILYIFFVLYGASMEAFVSRYYVSSIFQEDGLGSPISPIVISRAGGLLAICSLLVKGVNRWIKLVGFGLGIALLLLGSSRGPMVAFILCSLLIVFNYIRKGGFEIIILKFSGIIILVIGSLFLLNQYMSKINLGSINRLMNMLDSGGQGEERLYTWTAAWNQFVGSPIYGDSFVENLTFTYPHNIILEVLMSTGLIGFIPFSICIYYAFKKGIKLMNNENYIVFIIFLYGFISILFSGSIFSSPAFWMSLALVFVVQIPMQRIQEPNSI